MEVWHVRHGERCDEVSGAERRAWENSNVYRQGGANYDPPLTKHGHVQASSAGIYIKSLLSFDIGRGRDQTSGFDRVYVSPLMRAVQTAVCISQALGNLPLQVVPGLCSCTAAVARIGYKRAELIMTDADIAAAFPEVNIIPRDPLTPTSFRGAQAWLTARPDRRVLAVGHREGTRAMAGRLVPTPHCCIGIFKVGRADKSYTLRHLLSHTGEPLEAKRFSRAPAPRPPTPKQPSPGRLLRPRPGASDAPSAAAGNNDEEGAEALAARVMALSITPNHGGPNGSPSVKPAKPRRRSGPETAEPRPRGDEPSADTGRHATREPATTADDHTAVDTRDRLLSGAGSAERKPRGTPPTPLTTVGKPEGGADGESPAIGARSAGVASGAAGETGVKPGGWTLPTTTRAPTKPTGGAIGAADGYGQGSCEATAAAAASTLHREAGDAVCDDRTARPLLLSERRRHGHDDPAAAAPAAAASRSGRGDADLEGRGKPVTAAMATPVQGACAGRGFRVAALSRQSVRGAGSASVRHPGVAVGVLSGPMGVLSFLSPFELCAVRSQCRSRKTYRSAFRMHRLYVQQYEYFVPGIRLAFR